MDTIIKCDFDDFQGSESNFQNTDEVDTLHPCCTSSDYIETDNINDDVIKLFKQDIIDIGMSSVIHKCNGTCYKNFKHNGCRMGFGYDNEGKQLVEKTRIDKLTGEICIKRNHTHVSEFNPLMMVGFRSNHNIQFLGTSNEECLKRIYYLTNHVTKNGISSYQAIYFATCAYDKIKIDKNVSPDDNSKHILNKTYNFAANHTEY